MPQVLKLKRVGDCIKISSGVVSLTIDRQLHASFPNGPKQICDYIQVLLKKRVASAAADDFEIFESDLLAVWDQIESNKLENPLTMVVGVCGTNLKNIDFLIPDYQKESILISVNMSAEDMKAVHPFWFHYWVQKRIRSKGYQWEPDRSCTQSVWERVTHSKEKVDRFPILEKPLFNPQRHGKSYRIIARVDSGDIAVIIGSISNFTFAELTKAVISDIRQMVEKMSLEDNNTGIYKVFIKHIKTQLSRAYTGPQSLGVGLPLSFLGALRTNVNHLNQVFDPLLPLSYLCGLKAGLNSNDFLNSRLVVDNASIQGCHRRLMQMNLIVYDEKKKVDTVPPRILLNGFVQGYVNPEHCARGMESAKGALRIKEKHRLFNTMMIGISSNDIQKYYEELSLLKQKTFIIALENPGTEIYHINMQFFPLSRVAPKKNYKLTVLNNQFKDSRWCNLLIREMAGLQGVKNEPLWFAQHMEPAIPLDDIKASLNMLKKGGFLKLDPISRTLVQTAKDIISEVPKYTQGAQFHIDVIDLALYSKEWETKGKGEFISASVGCSPEGIKKIRKLCQDFMLRVFEIASSLPNPNVIYQASFQFFPLIPKKEYYMGEDETQSA